MLVTMNPSGSAIDRSTCVSAAKFTIASAPAIASATATGSSIAPCTKRMSDATSLQVLPATGVRELVEHGDLVAVLAHTQAHEVRADEAGAPADHQFHAALTSTTSARYRARPSRQAGRTSAASPRSERSTL